MSMRARIASLAVVVAFGLSFLIYGWLLAIPTAGAVVLLRRPGLVG